MTDKVDTPKARLRAVNAMVRAEKWKGLIARLVAEGVIEAYDTGGKGMMWKLSKPNDVVQAPVFILLNTGALLQGGKRIKGFGVSGALDAINISLGAADNDPTAE